MGVGVGERAVTLGGVPTNAGSASTVDLAALYVAEQPRLVRLAHLLTGSPEVAQEVVHDVFVRLHGRTDRADRIDNPAAYLRTAVVNACRSQQRRWSLERARAERPPSAPVELPPELDETWTALRQLPVRRRAALVLRYYEDLPDEEIARLLGCRPATVRSLIHRGLESLREVLEP